MSVAMRGDSVRDERRLVGWVLGFAALFFAVGFVGVRWWLQAQEEAVPPRYVEFRKLDVQNAVGLVVVSFDLAVDHQRQGLVEARKSALEARFREELAPLDPRAMYSREGKEALADGLRRVANHELGGDHVSAVYLGDFRIYERSVPR